MLPVIEPVDVETKEGGKRTVFFLATGRIPHLPLTGQEVAERINTYLPQRYALQPRRDLAMLFGGSSPYHAGSILAVCAAQAALQDAPLRPATPEELVAYLRRVDTRIPRILPGITQPLAALEEWEKVRNRTSNAAGLILYDTRSTNSVHAALLEEELIQYGLAPTPPALIWGLGLQPDERLPYGARFTVLPETRVLHAPAFADPGLGTADFLTRRDCSLEELVCEGRNRPVARNVSSRLKVRIIPGGLRVFRRHRNALHVAEHKLDVQGLGGRLLLAYR